MCVCVCNKITSKNISNNNTESPPDQMLGTYKARGKTH